MAKIGAGMGQFGLDKARENLTNPPDANNLPAGVPSRNVPVGSMGTPVMGTGPQRAGQQEQEPRLNPQQFGLPPHIEKAARMAQGQRSMDMLTRIHKAPVVEKFSHILAYAYGVHKDPETYAAYIHPGQYFGGVLAQHQRQQAHLQKQAAKAPKPPRISG